MKTGTTKTGKAATRPTVPEVGPWTRALYDTHHGGVGGHLHCVLDDGNYEDHFVESAIENAVSDGCDTCRQLGEVLLTMTRTQRQKLASKWTYQRRG